MARASDNKIRSPYPELVSGGFFLLAGLGLVGCALFMARVPPPLARLFFYLAGPLLVMAAGLLPAFLIARSRQRGRPTRRAVIERSGKLAVLNKFRAFIDRLWTAMASIDWLGDWLPVGITLVASLLALYAMMRGWKSTAPAPGILMDQIVGGALLVAAFPLLVLERWYAGIPETRFPEAPALSQLCRVPLLGLVALGVAAGLRWLGLGFAVPVEHAVGILTGLVAAELLLRSLVYIFVPLPPLAGRQSHAHSLVAGLIRARLPSLKALNASVRNQFGIDLARSWALGFVRRATVPLVLGMALLSWLLTGVTALGSNERAVYEAFGQPRAVLHPGLHVHWPWPFGTLRPVEYGTVNEIPIEFSADGKTPAAAQRMTGIDDIEGVPRPEDDRLWDAAHEGAEGSYLVAALSNGQQSFEAVDIDISIVYRIGLSDRDAMQAVYHIAAPEDSVQAISGQILSRYFARYTIDEILGQNRNAFIRSFQKELQARLSALSSGIEIMAVVVQGIHPPPKAAESYQGVQAAAIESVIKVSTADAESAREMKMAQVVANATRNDAEAAAAERVNQARMDFTLFDGDRKAYAAGGPSFLFERRLDRLDKGLADRPLIIVDHRIPPGALPTLDMRGAAKPKASFGDPGAD